MDKYKDERGATVERYTESLEVKFHRSQHWLEPWAVDALREFFRAEEDERLGRWRWPENPNWVCYATDEDRDVVVFDEDNPYIGTVTLQRGGDTWPHWRPAAEAYFDAHPEPNPWDQAEDGEVWALTGAGGLEQPWRRVDGKWISFTSGERPYDAVAATAGRRIWPGDAS